MKKSKKVLSLNKLTISRLNNLSLITGGTAAIESDVVTKKTYNPDYCPTGTLTCPDDPDIPSSLIFACDCGTQIQTQAGC